MSADTHHTSKITTAPAQHQNVIIRRVELYAPVIASARLDKRMGVIRVGHETIDTQELAYDIAHLKRVITPIPGKPGDITIELSGIPYVDHHTAPLIIASMWASDSSAVWQTVSPSNTASDAYHGS